MGLVVSPRCCMDAAGQTQLRAASQKKCNYDYRYVSTRLPTTTSWASNRLEQTCTTAVPGTRQYESLWFPLTAVAKALAVAACTSWSYIEYDITSFEHHVPGMMLSR